MGNDITDLPLAAALVVAVVSASLVTVLSALGVPASFVVIATMSIVGLGWGRATRTVGVSAGVPEPEFAVPADGRGVAEGAGRSGDASAPTDDDPTSLHAPDPDATGRDPAPSGTGGTTPAREATTAPSTAELYRPRTTARVLLLQNVVPVIATVAAYLLFRFVPA
jgi:PiT family inorganic phosphate transporter